MWETVGKAASPSVSWRLVEGSTAGGLVVRGVPLGVREKENLLPCDSWYFQLLFCRAFLMDLIHGSSPACN